MAQARGFRHRRKQERMKTNLPDEIQIAKLSIEAAYTALESLFKRMEVMPRAEKVMVSEAVQEACLRLQAAYAARNHSAYRRR